MASVGNDAVKHSAHYLSYFRQSGYRFVCFVFWRSVTALEVELDPLWGMKNPFSAEEGSDRSYHAVLFLRHPRGGFIVLPSLSLEVATSDINSLKLSSICESASQAVLSRMQLTLNATRHRTALRARCEQCLPGR